VVRTLEALADALAIASSSRGASAEDAPLSCLGKTHLGVANRIH
jgi:hypothetical protein